MKRRLKVTTFIVFVCVATYPEKKSRARARVGHPHSTSLVTFAMLSLLISAVGPSNFGCFSVDMCV